MRHWIVGILTLQGARCHLAPAAAGPLLPPVNPLMAFVPQIAFFLAHLLFGLVAGIVLAMAFHRPAVARALPASR